MSSWEWIETTIGEYCPFIYGKSLPQAKRVTGEYAVYGSNGIVDYHNEYCVKPFGIIIGRKGSVGEVHLSTKPFWAIDTSFYVVKDDIEELKFVYYLLKTLGLTEMNSDSAVPGLNRENAHSLKIKIPKNLEYRKYIGKQLSIFDEKIQLNTQINQTLEQIAQTIFKSWFIDFDPVHAKANALASGQTAEQATQAAMAVISGKNTQELHRLQTANLEQYQQLWEIAEAFPSGFDEEGVPWGWEEKSFGELLENTIGGDWGKDEVDEKHTEKVSILRGTDLPDVYKGNDKDVPTRFVEQKKLKSRKLQHSDIVIEVSGGSKNQPTGRSLLITDKLLSRFNNPIVPASFCRLFRPKSENYGYLLALHLQIIYQQGKTWEYQNQSTGISNFQTTHFLETEKVILPTNKTLMYFAEMVYPIFDKIYSNENQKLTEIRDELLPKLLSGEILNGN
ncbi:restriction endonuclease subunit S [Glaesserella parasuis]|uniref:restriction endonuclease subunit S n=1 Tax=Glaesserella parasuis TaxID=738 RepID=UPI0021BD062F|nr:restriction endonuclease subunit S [Glaesserella parasuis]MCT8582043.1 restriction endonuclease subunit S [Glaesserella parasuis]MCT8586195.1 restriction endonuclease subunit S [Glaesserella parasuis]MDE3988821.1 restriction endonuclease subunit S [Glaesserella parasuis]